MQYPRKPNRLIHETSPYLLQHAHNPVEWWPWTPEAFREARGRDVPVLLSVGYAACHWCHVMERESFEDDATADLMNRRFVCIKVDREERPDVDAAHMAALQALGGGGGWPLNVFLTPDGLPFHAGTYFPPADRYGMPAFRRVLEGVADAWRDRRTELAAAAEELRQAVDSHAPAGPGEPIAAAQLARAVAGCMRHHDRARGGFGGAPKFPQPLALELLLASGDPAAVAAVCQTLSRMARGGICDQIGGGFHRYATDADWLVPHFEKMLYDNALLPGVLLDAWRASRDPLLRRAAIDALDFLRADLMLPHGGFASSLDADTDGMEGLTYTWTPAEVRAVLPAPRSDRACAAFGITPAGNFEGRSIPTLADSAVEGFEELRRDLAAHRAGRPQPALDDKVIAAWNGMAIAAFASAGALLERPDYLQTARNAADCVMDELVRATGGGLRLARSGREVEVEDQLDPSRRSGRFVVAPVDGFLEDYACVADGLLELHLASGEAIWLARALLIAERIPELFIRPDGAPSETACDAEPLFARPPLGHDGATPAGASAAAMLAVRLAAVTGEERWERLARAFTAVGARDAADAPLAYGRLLAAAAALLRPARTVAIIGRADDPRTAALLRAARQPVAPGLIVAWADPDDADSLALPLFAGKPAAGPPAAWLCQAAACLPPIVDPAVLTAAIDGAARPA